MIIEQLQDEDEYKRIHGLVYNHTPERIPQVVFVGRNDDRTIVGFISGFWIESDYFYIEWSGVLPEYQKAGYIRYLNGMLRNDVIYECVVENINTVALKIVLSVGFFPIGFIVRGNKNFIQLKREKHE